MTVVSVASGANQNLVFSVTGTWATAFSESFAAYASSATSFVSLDKESDARIQPQVGTTTLYTFDQIGGSATVPAGGGYLLDSANGASTITGSGAGDTVLFAGVNQAGDYIDQGGSNQIIFVSGDNTYTGDTGSTDGTDTIVGGSGYDTISTGTNDAIVRPGTGSALITLNDTTTDTDSVTGVRVFNDYAYLDDGVSTVYADGTNDAVVANAAGQTIIGGTVAGALNAFVLNTAELAPTDSGNNLVVAGAATTAVFDDTSNNTIFGGTGLLYVSVGTGVTSADIVGGTGGNYVFGADGSTLALYATSADTAPNVLIGGSGTENLYGGISTGNLILVGGTAPDSTSAASYIETLTGGAGNDTLVSGSGMETLTGGAGNNVFVFDAQTDAGPATITVSDFGASAGNEFTFVGFTGDPIASETDGSAGVTLTLTDGSTITFLGETSAGLAGHQI